MPTRWIDPDEFLEHDGLTVYRVYKGDDVDEGPRRYWFTLDPSGSDDDDHGENGVFDVRDLPGAWDAIGPLGYGSEKEASTIKTVIAAAIDVGYFADWRYEGKGDDDD